MNEPIIILCVFAILVVVASVVVRLALAPRRRNLFLESLMDILIETDRATQDTKPGHAEAISIEQLSDNLFRHFERSTISRNVLGGLGDARRGTE